MDMHGASAPIILTEQTRSICELAADVAARIWGKKFNEAFTETRALDTDSQSADFRSSSLGAKFVSPG